MRTRFRFWWWLRGTGGVVVNAITAAFSRGVADPLRGADRLESTAAYRRSILSTLSGADVLANTAGESAAHDDTGTMADGLTGAAHYVRTLADGLQLADALTSPGDNLAGLPRRLNAYTLNALTLN